MLPTFRYLAVVAIVALSHAQDYDDYRPAHRPAPSRVQPGYNGPAAPKPTPVPILKQINRHNEDGSYTYGYESADGAFKIETKLATGEVKGKYGYVDDTGKVRVVEYGATKYGFEPSGEGITVAPPTLVDESTNKDGTLVQDYYDQEPEPLPQPVKAPRPKAHSPIFDFGPQSQFAPEPRAPKPRPQYRPEPAPQFIPGPPPRSAAPVPSRAHIPGAVPSTQNIEFGPPPARHAPAPARHAPPPSRGFAPVSFGNPAPIEEDYNEPPARPAPRPAPKITYAPQPAPPQQSFIPRAQPQFAASAPRPKAAPAGRGGILDQLSKDYALPQGGAAALHDISFGYY